MVNVTQWLWFTS